MTAGTLRTALAALLVVLLLALARVADAEEETPTYTAEDTLAAIETVSPEYRDWIRATVHCETRTWDPYAVGDGGKSFGAAQLHTHGLLPLFYQWGFSDPFDPYQSISFMEAAFKAGLAYQWTCA